MSIALQHHWSRLNPATLPPPHRGSSLVFDNKRQQSVLVTAGGTWLWNGATWSQVQDQSTPPARNTTHLVYDASTECVLLFGGIGIDGTPLNDTWLWNGATWTEQHPADFPPPVGGAAIAYTAAHQQVILFGGIAGFDGVSGSNRVGTFSNETWIWNGTSWTEQRVSGPPPERAGAQLVYDELHQQTLLFSGNSLSGYLDDMWRWNGTGWDALHPTTLPPAQARYSMVFHQQLQQVMLVGEVMGGVNQSERLHQIWLWDGMSWSQYPSADDLPGSIEGLAYDGTRNIALANVVIGEKLRPGKKNTNPEHTDVPPPTLVSETWAWG